MSDTAANESAESAVESFRLSPQQLLFYDTFGFLRLPGLFADDIEEITEAFEAEFARDTDMNVEASTEVHFNQRRLTALCIVDRNARLNALRDDPRILGIVRSIFEGEALWGGSDGNLMWCDTGWHCDIYDAPIHRYHLKLFFYLDPVDAQSGGLRFIPGTHFFNTTFATTLRDKVARLDQIESAFGVPLDELPSVPVPSEPGDLILGNFRTIHATFHGGPRRRLFTMNYRDARPPGAPRTRGDVPR